MQHAIVGLIAALSLPAMAQQPVYRCGSTYSQTPCDGAKPPAALKAGTPQAAADQQMTGQNLCAASLARQQGFADAASAGIYSVEKAPAAAIQYQGAPLVAHKYVVTYRSRLYSCFLSEDERRVLSVDAPSVQAANAGAAGSMGRDPRIEREETLRLAAEAAEKKRRAEERAQLRLRMGLPP